MNSMWKGRTREINLGPIKVAAIAFISLTVLLVHCIFAQCQLFFSIDHSHITSTSIACTGLYIYIYGMFYTKNCALSVMEIQVCKQIAYFPGVLRHKRITRTTSKPVVIC